VPELQRRLYQKHCAYLGWQRQVMGLRGITFRWGWKDSCNMLTLPLWLMLFPNAKVIFIVRNGIDVARSLVERESGASKKFESLIKRHLCTSHSIRCRDFDESFALWESYAEIFEAFSLTAIPDRGQLLCLRYEDLLLEPAKTIARLAAFVDLPADLLVPLPRKFDASRAYAYQALKVGGEEFEKYHRSDWMVHYGYGSGKSS